MGYKVIRKDRTATSLGCLSKAWYSDGKYEFLVKGNMQFKDGTFGYEPFSEYIASVVAKHLGLRHTQYVVAKNNFKEVNTYGVDYVSICKKEENPPYSQRISALQYVEMLVGKEINTNYWGIFNRYMPNKDYFIAMLIFDAIIGNEDRHLNNWDIIISTKETYIAPIMDNGASLLAYVKDKDLSTKFTIGRDKSKPFKNTHTKQIALIKQYYPNYKWEYSVQDLEIILMNIINEIRPVTSSLGYRGECIEKYLINRMRHYGTMFCKR